MAAKKKGTLAAVEEYPKCDHCKKGYHLGGIDGPRGATCVGRACGCWCRSGIREAKPFRETIVCSHAQDPELAKLLLELRALGCRCRMNVKYELVWNPKMDTWPSHLVAAASVHMGGLCCTLAPNGSPTEPHRPFWEAGEIAACVCCGRGTAMVDPLGQSRHPNCGWYRNKTPIDMSLPSQWRTLPKRA